MKTLNIDIASCVECPYCRNIQHPQEGSFVCDHPVAIKQVGSYLVPRIIMYEYEVKTSGWGKDFPKFCPLSEKT